VAEAQHSNLNFIFLAVSGQFAGSHLYYSAKDCKNDGKAKALHLGPQPIRMCEFAKSASSHKKHETRNCE
jgi:hypothetical protein